MLKKIIIIFILRALVILELTAFLYFNPETDKDVPILNSITKPDLDKLSIENIKINIEIADEPKEQSQGLSGREYLAPDSGMLFVFPQLITPSFWMKDMKFSLDLIWIDENGKIIEITKNVSPATYPKSFLPPSPIKYVLEVNAGYTEENNIKAGDEIVF